MLIENLYTLDTFSSEGGKAIATITVNANHKIFEGHFPGQPVLPGVCQLQIIKELLERATGKKLFLSEAGSFKFLQMVDPAKTNVLEIIIAYNFNDTSISANATIKSGAVVFLKMNSGVFLQN
ncbi:3-hydroxyacyl-ACP dehydratase [Niabella aquatica]